MSKISVITVVRNDCTNIEKTMLSVLKQGSIDYEYIVKDGLSDDGTQNIISRICQENSDKRIRYVSSKDTGIYDAMNQAVEYCEGEWVIFINSGDLFLNQYVLEKCFQNKDYKEYGVLYGDTVVRDETEDVIWRAKIDNISKKMPFCHQSCFVRRELLLKNVFDVRYKIAADYNHLLDLYVAGVKFLYVNQIISIFTLDGVSSTKFIERYRERNQVRKQHEVESWNYVGYFFGFAGEMMKTVIGKSVPMKMQKTMRHWYKRYVKRYERETE